MPEGDTIHALARILDAELAGRALAAATLEHQPVRAWRGATVDEVFAIGKHLFVAVGRDALRTHLGMEGTWHRYRPDEARPRPAWSESALLATAERVFVCYRAREAEIVDLAGDRHRRFLRRLGPDVLGAEFDARAAVARARALLAPDAPLADLLLDQRVAAGVGNVYTSELCFRAGRAPAARIGDLDDAALAALLDDARALLGRNLGPGRRRTRDGGSGPAVYRRAGEPCPTCATPIRTARLGRNRRSTYWCPRCQR